jgi:hypothetical protein
VKSLPILLALVVLVLMAVLSSPVMAQKSAGAGMTPEQAIEQIRKLPPGVTLDFEQTTRTKSGDAHGAQIAATGTDVAGKADVGTPGLNLGDGESSNGGEATSETKAHTVVSAGGAAHNPIFWLGLAMALPAGWFFYRREPLDGAACLLGGLGLVGASMVPAWAWVGIGLALAAVVGLYLWAKHSHNSEASLLWDRVSGLRDEITKKHEALRAVVAGVESAPAEAQAAVKVEIGKQADQVDRETIRNVKVADGLI